MILTAESGRATQWVPTGLHVLVTGVPSDSHTWNLIYLQLALEERGHRVTNLGPCVSADLLVTRCRELAPDLIVMSSVNGHGRTDGETSIRALRKDSATAHIIAVIGGKLGIDGDDTHGRDALRGAGFDAVFGDADLDPFFNFVDSLSPVVAR